MEIFEKINGSKVLFFIRVKIKKLLLSFFVFACLGVLYTFFFHTKEYASYGKILPEYPSKNSLAKYAGLASLAGVDLSSMENVEAIRPDIYPDILKGTPFFYELLELEIITKENQKVTFEEYYNTHILPKKYIQNFLYLFDYYDRIIPSDSTKKTIILSKKEENRLEDLKERISLILEKKTGILTLQVQMPDPLVAVAVTKFSMDYLIKYVIKYRTEKAQKYADFLENQMIRAKNKYYTTQSQKSHYSDFYQPFTRTNSANIQKERLESEHTISSGFYSNLVMQHEQAKLKVEESMPIIKILDPPNVSLRSIGMGKSAVIFLFGLLGLTLRFGTLLLQNQNYRQIFNEN